MADESPPKKKVRCPACDTVIVYDDSEVEMIIRKSTRGGSEAFVKCTKKECGKSVSVPFPESPK